MADQNNAPERIWVRVTDKTVMYAKPSDADEFDVEYIRADRAAPPPPCQKEAVTVAESALVDLYYLANELSWDRRTRDISDRILVALRALKGES